MGPEADIYSRLSTFDAFTATGATLFQGEPRPDATTPWAAYQVEEIEPSSPELNSSGQLFRHALTVSMSADSYAELRTLHDAVRAALDQFSGGQVAYCGYDRADLSYTDEAQKNRMGVIEFTVVATEALILPVESGTPMVEVREDGLYFDGEKLGAGSELPENIAFTDQANTFTEPQTITPAGSSAVVKVGSPTAGYGGIGFGNTFNTGTAALFGTSTTTTLQAPSGTLSVRIGNDFGGAGGIDFVGAGKVGVNNGSPGASLHTKAFSASTIGAIVQGAASQSADLTQWQDSTGAVMAKVVADGGLFLSSSRLDGIGGIRLISSGTVQSYGTQTGIYGNEPNTVTMLVKGAASQSADLTQWQDSTGAVVGKVSASRTLSVIGPEAHTGVEVRLGSVDNAYPGVYSTGSACLIGDGGITLSHRGTSTSLFTQSGGWRLTPASGATYAMRWDNSSGTEIAALTPGGGLTIGTGTGGVGFVLNPTGNNYSYSLSAGNSGTGTFGMASNTTVSFSDGIQTPLSLFTNYYAATPVCTVDLQGVATVTGIRPANVVLTVKGAASQNEDLQRWVDSTGSTRARVDNAGGASFIGNLSVGGNSGSPGNNYLDLMSFGGNGWWRLYSKFNSGTSTFDLTSNNSGYTPFSIDSIGTTAAYGAWTHQPTSAGQTPLVVKEAASQTADAFQVQTSTGAAYFKVNQNGSGDRSQMSLTHGSHTASLFVYGDGGVYLDTPNAPFRVRANGSSPVLTVFPSGVVAAAVTATDVPLKVRGTTSQTGDLQQWQDSTEAVKARMTPAGKLYLADYVAYSGTSTGTAVIDVYGGATSGSLHIKNSTGGTEVIIGNVQGDGTNCLRLHDLTTPANLAGQITAKTYLGTHGRITIAPAANGYDPTATAITADASDLGVKLGFFGASAVLRQPIAPVATDAAETMAAVNSIRAALINLGLCT